MARKRLALETEEDKYVEIITGGPKKVYNRRRVRKPFTKLPVKTIFQPIESKWYQEILEQIVASRRRMKLSQMTLAGMIGTSQAEISRFESGKTNSTVEFLDRILKTLNLEIHFDFEPACSKRNLRKK